MAYASITDVQARLQGTSRAITASTTPSTTHATQWLVEAEARINGALAGAGVSPVPVVNTNGIEILKTQACNFAEGRCRRVFAAAGGDGSNQDGLEELKAFEEFVAWIQNTNPAVVEATLSGGGAGGDAIRLRSHATNDVDGRASDHADFQPEFTKSAGADQF